VLDRLPKRVTLGAPALDARVDRHPERGRTLLDRLQQRHALRALARERRVQRHAHRHLREERRHERGPLGEREAQGGVERALRERVADEGEQDAPRRRAQRARPAPVVAEVQRGDQHEAG
jgi:hypothetical protein